VGERVSVRQAFGEPPRVGELGNRLVVAALAAGQLRLGLHQLAAERLGQHGLRQPVGAGRRGTDALLDGVGHGEQGGDAADDLGLFGAWSC
jgi:hypothetical protein